VGTTSKVYKLAELRAKTDWQLLAVIERGLERGLVLASVAATRDSALYMQAKLAYEEAHKLLPTIYGLSQPRQLEAKLKELRAALDRAPRSIGSRILESSELLSSRATPSARC
jgi:hypothetical protein